MLTKHLLAILATWRITEILVDEDAPFDLAVKLRDFVASESLNPIDYSNGYGRGFVTHTVKNRYWYEVHKALSCRYCLSVQIGIMIAIVTRTNPLWGFAYSAGSLLFGKIFNAIPQYIHGEIESTLFQNGIHED